MKEDEGSILHIYMDESERSKALANKFVLPQTLLGVWGWVGVLGKVATPGKL